MMTLRDHLRWLAKLGRDIIRGLRKHREAWVIRQEAHAEYARSEPCRECGANYTTHEQTCSLYGLARDEARRRMAAGGRVRVSAVDADRHWQKGGIAELRARAQAGFTGPDREPPDGPNDTPDPEVFRARAEVKP